MKARLFGSQQPVVLGQVEVEVGAGQGPHLVDGGDGNGGRSGHQVSDQIAAGRQAGYQIVSLHWLTTAQLAWARSQTAR